MKRSRKFMSAAERAFKARFDEEVLAKRPVLTMERVRGITDPHHVLPRSWLASHDRFRHLEGDELWAVLYDPDNGIPCDRVRHEQITNAHKRLSPDELRPENVEFAVKYGLTHRLHVEVPGLTVEHA